MDKKLEARIDRLERLLSLKSESLFDDEITPLASAVADVANQVSKLARQFNSDNLAAQNELSLSIIEVRLKDIKADCAALLTLL
jgi:hypothetical protein